MGDFHICGFEIPVAPNGFQYSSKTAGGDGYAVNGQPISAALYLTEEGSITTPEIPLSTARAIESLCRRGANGHVWHADEDGSSSRWSSAGLGTITASPNFSAVEFKFGTHSFLQAFGAIGDVSIATVGTIYTVASWVKVGAGSWQHEVLRSDGAKWVDGVRNDSATLNISVASSVFKILEPGSGNVYFDDLVWLPFSVPDGWPADWPTSRAFANLPDLEVSGDLLGGYRIAKAVVGCRVQGTGQVGHDGTLQDSATVSLDIRGSARVEDV